MVSYYFVNYNKNKQNYSDHTELLEKLLTEGFKTERIVAKQTTENDIIILSDYLMDKRITSQLDPTLKNGFDSKDSAVKFLSDDLAENNRFTFSITLNDLQTPIGQVSYTYSDGMLMPSFWIATDYQKKGYASEIILPLTQKIFESCVDIKTLYVVCDYENISSLNLCEKLCGFINEDNNYYITKDEGYTSGEFEGETIEFHYWELKLSKK